MLCWYIDCSWWYDFSAALLLWWYCRIWCSEININEEENFYIRRKLLRGRIYSLDGTTGNIYLGDIKTQEATISGNFERIMEWADEIRTMKIRTNADSPEDAANAIKFGAEGIGLTRTEHMFFEAERIPKIRKMILSKTVEAREAALNELIPYQKNDFKGIYEVMEDRPVTIRFLDPPLHEFLPTEKKDMKD